MISANIVKLCVEYQTYMNKNSYIAYEYFYNMKSINILSVSLFLLVSACLPGSVHSALDDIESYIMDRPDSALVVLESMNMDVVKSNRDIAHHALLHAMALDKNFIDVSDDSLAKTAVGYFSKNGPRNYEARSRYYLGLAYYYSGQHKKAIIEFTKAEDIAKTCDSLYWGMIKIKQADTYGKTHNNIEKLNCLQQAYNIYKELNSEYYLDVSHLYLAQALFNVGREEDAEEILINLIKRENLDSKVRNSAQISCAFLKANPQIADFKGSVSLYENVISKNASSYMSYKDFWAMSYSLFKIGRNDEAMELVDQLSEVDSSGTAWYWKYMIAKADNDFAMALQFYELSTEKIYKEVTDALQESLALTQRDYYKSVSEIAEYKTENRNLIIILSIVLAVLVIGIVLWLSFKRIRFQQEEKERYLQYANEIKLQLDAYQKSDYPALKRKYVELFKSRFEMVGSLYEQYTLSYGKKNAEHSIYERVSKIVSSITDDYVNTKLIEDMLDDGLDNIMTNLRSELPSLNEKDYMLFRLMAVGFDVTTISHLLNNSMNSIYIRKSRMKSHIESMNPEHKSQFMSILS